MDIKSITKKTYSSSKLIILKAENKIKDHIKTLMKLVTLIL